eukprot:Tamp_09291.p4 GENE.Tamp_09291~~Tamp_09291.p4  ORF type:complete len:145 (+),score=6.85 Tamp_09291:301-735(+)
MYTYIYVYVRTYIYVRVYLYMYMYVNVCVCVGRERERERERERDACVVGEPLLDYFGFVSRRRKGRDGGGGGGGGNEVLLWRGGREFIGNVWLGLPNGDSFRGWTYMAAGLKIKLSAKTSSLAMGAGKGAVIANRISLSLSLRL